MNITKPSILRLAKKVGVKSVSDSCYNLLNEIIEKKAEEIVNALLVVNSQHSIKTLSIEDLYNALRMLDINLTFSTEIGVCTEK
jgi:histone H3/H4